MLGKNLKTYIENQKGTIIILCKQEIAYLERYKDFFKDAVREKKLLKKRVPPVLPMHLLNGAARKPMRPLRWKRRRF